MTDSVPGNDDDAPSGKRKLAEWISFGVSVVLILATAAALIWKAMEPNAPMVDVAAVPLLDQAQETGGRFVLPVKVENHGDRTLHDLKVELSFQPPDDTPQTTDAMIDYLGEHSEQVLYFYFEEDPRSLNVEARPASYRLE